MRVRLIDICQPKQWQTISTDMLLPSGYPVYGANGVIGYYDKYNHKDPTIMITCRGATCGTINISEPFSYINGNAMSLDNLSEDVMIKYLYYQLINYNFKEVISGSAQPQITREALGKVWIEFHTITEQKKIANNLEKIEFLIEKRKQQLEKLDLLVKTQFIEMFGNPVSNTLHWDIAHLGELGELGRGVSKARPRNAPDLLGGVHPLVQTGEVASCDTYIVTYENTYSDKGLAQSKKWAKGTLCITIAANIAQTGILTFDACFPDSVVGFVAGDKTSNIFIHYWFMFFQRILEEQAPQVAQKNINLQILNNLKVIVPPKSKQDVFVSFVEQTDKSKFVIKRSLEKLETLKKALMQKYFG